MSGNTEEPASGSGAAGKPIEPTLPKLEDRLKVFDYRLKLAGLVLTVAGLFFNGFVYYTQKQKEIQSGFFKSQLEMYLRAASAVGKLSAGIDLRNRERIAAGSAEFWEAYHGPMTLVEGRPAAAQMIEMGKLVQKIDEYLRNPQALVDRSQPVFMRFQLRADCLGTTLRKEIIESYDVRLPVDETQLNACRELDKLTASQ